MRILTVVVAALAITTGPVAAQEAPDADRQAQLDRAERYLEISQGSGMAKVVRQQLDELYAGESMPAEQQAWLSERMGDVYEEVMDLVVVEMRDDVADRFTAPELQALIAFYDTPAGRSILNKEAEMKLSMQRAMMPHLMERMMDLGEKFCLRFDCAAAAGAARKGLR